MARRVIQLEDMTGFPTANKRPKMEWRDRPDHRWSVGALFHDHDQVGIVPGEQGCVVIDIDRKNGVDGFVNLKKKFRNLPPSLNYRTLSGGAHLWYAVPDGIRIPQRTSKVPGIDIRHLDGYVCVGRDYEPQQAEFIEECPKPLLDWLTELERVHVGHVKSRNWTPPKIEPGKRPPKGSVKLDFSPIPVGQRNDGLYRWGFGVLNALKSGEMDLENYRAVIFMKGQNSGLPNWEIELVLESLLTNLP